MCVCDGITGNLGTDTFDKDFPRINLLGHRLIQFDIDTPILPYKMYTHVISLIPSAMSDIIFPKLLLTMLVSWNIKPSTLSLHSFNRNKWGCVRSQKFNVIFCTNKREALQPHYKSI